VSMEQMLIFIVFTQVGQVLMSFDGGAIQMSQTALSQDGWTPAHLGMYPRRGGPHRSVPHGEPLGHDSHKLSRVHETNGFCRLWAESLLLPCIRPLTLAAAHIDGKVLHGHLRGVGCRMVEVLDRGERSASDENTMDVLGRSHRSHWGRLWNLGRWALFRAARILFCFRSSVVCPGAF